MCNGKCTVGCVGKMIAKWLLIIGGLNWGLMGVGMLMGNDINSWNVIHMLLQSVPVVEAIIYVLVGLAAIVKVFGCRCKKCVEAHATCCGGSDNKVEGSM